MRRGFIAVVIFLLTTVSATAVDNWYIYKNATLNTTSVALDFGFSAKAITVTNLGAANIVYVDWGGLTATNADFELRVGQSYTTPPGLGTNRKIAVVCSAATCDMQVLAVN